MIVSAHEGGKLIRYLKVEDSYKIQYSSACLKEKGGEVEDLRISKYSNQVIARAKDNQ